MLIWIQDLKGNQQMYGLITELERRLGLRWPSEWTIPRGKKNVIVKSLLVCLSLHIDVFLRYYMKIEFVIFNLILAPS